MEKQKRWHFYLILMVIALTFYNILPTVFYYAQPLRSPVNAQQAEKISYALSNRVNGLEDQAQEWLQSFSKLLKVYPTSIGPWHSDPGVIEVAFPSAQEANRFKRLLPKAGALIPFVPAQLQLYPGKAENENSVLVQREVRVRLDNNPADGLFHFFNKKENEEFTAEYRDYVKDRATLLLSSFGGDSLNGRRLATALNNTNAQEKEALLLQIATDMVDFEKSFAKQPALIKRYMRSYAQNSALKADSLAETLSQQVSTLKDKLAKQRDNLLEEEKKLKSEKSALDPAAAQQLQALDSQLRTLSAAATTLKNYGSELKQAAKPLSEKESLSLWDSSAKEINKSSGIQTLTLKGKNPFVEALLISWNDDQIRLKLYDDVQALRQSEISSEESAIQQARINQYLINELAFTARESDETLLPYEDSFTVPLSNLQNAESFLSLNLSALAQSELNGTAKQIEQGFQRRSRDLAVDAYPLRTHEAFLKESAEQQKFGLVLYAPATEKGLPPQGFSNSSIYVVAKGMQSLLQKAQASAQSPESKLLMNDLEELRTLMEGMNFILYSGDSYGVASEFKNDLIFAKSDFYGPVLKASREEFEVKGSKRKAILPFSDLEQRILTENKIDDQTQEDLLRWEEAYQAAQIDLDPIGRYLVPAPTTNPYWSNFKISFAKYFRGDERKILKWGLDLSGGKTVRIGLRDSNNRPVTNPEDIKQAVNELYTRINKMGVSERTIRVENNNIILEFPGSQALSASDLVKASAMYFHIVNEKFSTANPTLKSEVSQFLRNVWNEAVVTNRKDIDSIKEIAFKHLGGNSSGQDAPISAAARTLYENGLRLSNPADAKASNAFNDSVSTIAMMSGDDFMEWDGQPHPLLIVFNNYALEGSSLTGIRVGYDQTEGNNLSFTIKRSYDTADRTGSPRDDFYAWTSQFGEDKIAGSAREAYTQGRGWRMAVILNGAIISKPVLRAALKEGATISGRFTQREVDQLAADLKAGSLSFTPKILSEQNVSAELGAEERFKGIAASLIALSLVVIAMCAYYRFAGVVASVAVLLNIFIMWGVLQNLDAALTLPAIAGIVLTIGMAVDANVLVFERVREEFAVSGRIASAIQAGYRKAFSAIVDSNITTIIAALILTQFDSGPIKGFAVTLIVGIVSSMFTSLFVTRYYFAGWVQNPAHKSLEMSQFFKKTNFDFLSYARIAIISSFILMIAGGFFLFEQRKSILGMDFTGGYALNVEVEPVKGIDSYRLTAYDALIKQGASPRDVQVRELTKPNQLKLQLGIGIEEQGQPFHLMPQDLEEGKFAFNYQHNPRLTWVVKAFEENGLKISDAQLESIDENWSVMSGQFSDAMRNNAILALGLALLGILVYITIRFEFKYACAAVIGLAHDVAITLGIIAFFNALGFAVQIDLQVIGAIMTIIGYSLNDTIIVFDRIREDIKLMRKASFPEIINHALNVTLSRTVMTSGTTLLVLIALVLLGGQTIFAFSLVMTIGVLVGTFSSLFIATPVLLYLHNREEEKAAAARLNNV